MSAITIQCWSGKILFQGDHKDKEVDEVLDANRCDCGDVDDDTGEVDLQENCKECGGTGYASDFDVMWDDIKDSRNVYEHINY